MLAPNLRLSGKKEGAAKKPRKTERRDSRYSRFPPSRNKKRKMVKAYLRYEPAAVFGVVASVECNVCYDNTGKLLFTGALEQLCVWNLKQGLCIKALASSTSSGGPKSAASAIACSPSSDSTVMLLFPLPLCLHLSIHFASSGHFCRQVRR